MTPKAYPGPAPQPKHSQHYGSGEAGRGCPLASGNCSFPSPVTLSSQEEESRAPFPSVPSGSPRSPDSERMRMSPLCSFIPRLLHPRGSHTAVGTFVPPCPPLDPEKFKELQRFILLSKRLLVMTGAGVSTESGIPDYRSEKVGLYARTDRRPIQHVDFVRSAKIRQRYWARNFVGWPQFSSHQPNAAHLTLSSWERLGKLYWLVTQNVDALHTKAGSRRLTELHGCMHRVLCLHCGVQTPRQALQDRFEALNATWEAKAHGVAPDGDVFLTEDQVRSFQVPSCAKCGGPLKPDVVFFGDTVNHDKVDFVHMRVKEADAILVVGSSLQVYSGYKFILAAHEKKLPIAILNIGPTRSDQFACLKLDFRCAELLPLIAPQ